jgi:hypothetical protein
VGFEPLIRAFERAKTVRALDCADTLIGKNSFPRLKLNHGLLGLLLVIIRTKAHGIQVWHSKIDHDLGTIENFVLDACPMLVCCLAYPEDEGDLFRNVS